jgi:hypothetical protein
MSLQTFTACMANSDYEQCIVRLPVKPILMLQLQGSFHKVDIICLPIPMAARSKAWVYGRSLTEIVGPNPAANMDVCLLRVLCDVR